MIISVANQKGGVGKDYCIKYRRMLAKVGKQIITY